MRQDRYRVGLVWIMWERGGPNGGWPPRDVNKVCGWAVVRLLAAVSDREPKQVAQDLIDMSELHDAEDRYRSKTGG